MNHTLLFLGPSDGHEEERERERSLSPQPPIAMSPPLPLSRTLSLPPPPPPSFSSSPPVFQRELRRPREWRRERERESVMVCTPHTSDKRKTMRENTSNDPTRERVWCGTRRGMGSERRWRADLRVGSGGWERHGETLPGDHRHAAADSPPGDPEHICKLVCPSSEAEHRHTQQAPPHGSLEHCLTFPRIPSCGPPERSFTSGRR